MIVQHDQRTQPPGTVPNATLPAAATLADAVHRIEGALAGAVEAAERELVADLFAVGFERLCLGEYDTLEEMAEDDSMAESNANQTAEPGAWDRAMREERYAI